MKNISFYLIIISVLLVFSCTPKKNVETKKAQEVVDYMEESPESFDQRMEWWRDARFGMFIHWGIYAVPAGIYNGKEVEGIGEWIVEKGQIPMEEYEKFAKQFDPVKFNADEWVQIIKDAGMKYLVITSKHHDGFSLWDSKISDYDIVDTSPYGKDVLLALSKACKKQGVKFGLYYSIMDWHHPDAQAYSYLKDDPRKRADNKDNFANYFENYMKPQLKELVVNYDPDIIWFDGQWVGDFTHEQGLELYQYIRTLKPSILINNRVDKGRSGGKQGMNKEDDKYAGDFGTPEQKILDKASVLDWESCMTMNGTWGFKKNDHNWKSAEALVHNLIDITAKGGNYLLNVGPTAEGLIPEPSVERLKKTGDWLKVNGEAIYGTKKLQNSYKQGEDFRFTRKKESNIFYALSLKKPKASVLLKNLKPEEGSKIYLLGIEKALIWEFISEEGLKISIPKEILNTWNKNSFAWTFRITGEEL